MLLLILAAHIPSASFAIVVQVSNTLCVRMSRFSTFFAVEEVFRCKISADFRLIP